MTTALIGTPWSMIFSETLRRGTGTAFPATSFVGFVAPFW
jgi:hypothetical protein